MDGISGEDKERQLSEVNLNQPAIYARPGQEALTASDFLTMVENRLDLVQKFFKFERMNIVKGVMEMPDPRISMLSPGRNAPFEKMFIYTIYGRFLRRRYYARFPDLDFTKNLEAWVKMMNPGYRTEGKLRTFAIEEGLPLNLLRKSITVNNKEWMIEVKVSEPGIAAVLTPVIRKLDHLSYRELELACYLLCNGQYPNTLTVARRYSDDICKLQSKFDQRITSLYPQQPRTAIRENTMKHPINA